MEDDEEVSNVEKPSIQVEDEAAAEEDLPSAEQCEPVPELDDSQLVGEAEVVAAKEEEEVKVEAVAEGEEAVAEGEEETLAVETGMEMETEVVEAGGGGDELEVEVEVEGEADEAVAEEEETPTAEVGMEMETEVVEGEDGDEEEVEAEADAAEDAVAEEEETPTAEAEMEMETETEVAGVGRGGGGRRKRGRNSRVPVKAPSRKREEEDVCFICFDGGELVLCDRRGCPKAYHPSCINRDEAFFKAKGRWTCGWHLCSKCEKNAACYMCYTCTYSLCKGCIKDAVILCVRENKGFCETCIKTVMLIEKNEQGNNEMAQVDFDDKSSWEYLFKDYWLDLKGKLLLTLEEISDAKNPCKGSDVVAGKQDSADELYDAKNDGGSGSDSSSGNLKTSNSKRRKAKKRSKSLTKKGDSPVASDSSSGNLEASKSKKRKAKKRLKSNAKEGDSPSAASAISAEGTSTPGRTEWASKELLEFVMHMKDGDTSVSSQFDVQALLLEYIKRNKLRDPRRKSQIICDARLENLFGKPRVGHFEMLKLLESHFLIREDSQADDLQGSVVDTEASQLEADGNIDALMKAGKDRRRKTRRKGDERGSQSNLDDYAAIDMHNINLVYLRRNLAEGLIEDIEKFHDKVVGSFVRIRIPGSGQKQEIYRLVQVVGTSKAAEPYKVGKRTTDIMLEILNLDKTEVISIDIISNQEFTEDECKRLRQSIKCGLINRLTVGDIQEKAMALQALRVNDWLEAEIVRLSHLRDRASEIGHRKELRECVEKLQLLKTPEERQRRLEEIPEVHADPNMDPSYESEEDEGETDDKKPGNFMRPRGTGFGRRGRDSISPRKGGSASNDSWSGTRNYPSMNRELSRNMSNKGFSSKSEDSSVAGEMVNENMWSQGRDRDLAQPKSWENQNSASNSETGGRNIHTVVASESFSGVVSDISPAPLSAGIAQSASKISETEKMWHYQDPSGRVQGPFSVVQLRKWSGSGYFPADLRIWRTTEKQDDSILLTDVLAIKFEKEMSPTDNSFPNSQKVQSPHLSSSFPGKPYGTPLQPAREGQGGERSHGSLGSAGPSAGSQLEISSSKGRTSLSVEAPKLSTNEWGSDYGRNESSNLPSPTPTQTTAGRTGEQAFENKLPSNYFSVQPTGSALGANLFPGGNGMLQTPASVTPESSQLTHLSTPSSSIKPGGVVDGSNVSHATFSQQMSVSANKEHTTVDYLGAGVPPSVSNSGGQLTLGSENDRSSSLPVVSAATKPEMGFISTNAPLFPSQTTVPGESHSVQAGTHLLPEPNLASAPMNPGTDPKNAGASFPNFAQPVTTHNPTVETHGWPSSSIAKPEMVASCPIPGNESQAWGSAPSQQLEPNNQMLMPSQQPTYGHWGNTPSPSFSTGNPSGNFPTPGFSSVPPSEHWRPSVPGNQSNMQPPVPPNLPWGMGVTENPSAAPRMGPEHPSTGWGPMPGNPNMGWVGPVPGNANMNWGASGQGPAPGNANPGWVIPGQGPAPGNANPGWVAPGNANPGWVAPGQGPTPGNVNPGWIAPGPGPAPGNTNPGWIAPGPGPAPGNTNPGWVAPGQGPPPGNTNSGWIAPAQGPAPGNTNPGWVAPNGNQGRRGSEQNYNGDRYSSQRDRGSQGGDPGSGGGRPWNRQSSFGSGGGGGSSRALPRGQRVCTYYESGHCKKGASCDYLHP
ncbi:hypothetical protein L1049_015042 [Liquidambar formosana]|uniref:Zinc finger CCCH domain-containing protein 19 n=1 Tax=Liquidambar formosana TaxID=63359 RepID=A0AAP0X1L9_LIQFO